MSNEVVLASALKLTFLLLAVGVPGCATQDARPPIVNDRTEVAEQHEYSMLAIPFGMDVPPPQANG